MREGGMAAASRKLAVIVGLALAAGAQAEEQVSYYQLVKLLGADVPYWSDFGDSVAISGDTIVVSAPGYESAYVFERDAGGPDAWGQVAKLRPGQDLDGCVAIFGDTIVVGASVTGSGSAYVFERDLGGPDAWGQAARLLAADGAPGDKFGRSAAIFGDTVVVGATRDDDLGTDSGSAYVFERDLGGPNAWEQAAKLLAADGVAWDRFGRSVTIAGDTVAVGSDRGAAYVFERDAGGPEAWLLVAKLLHPNGSHADFGSSVAVLAGTVVVGAPNDDELGDFSGSAVVFERDAGGPGTWEPVAKLLAADGEEGDSLGESVAIAGDTVVVGATFDDDLGFRSGSAYIFQRDAGGPEAWGQVAKLLAGDGAGGDYFGGAVAIAGETVVAGARQDDDRGDSTGSAYVYQETTVAPFITATGPCPGEMTVDGTDLTPKGDVELYGSAAEGMDTVPGGPCVGTPLSLDGARKLTSGEADEAGGISRPRTMGDAVCGAYLQALDRTSCAVSNVERILSTGRVEARLVSGDGQ